MPTRSLEAISRSVSYFGRIEIYILVSVVRKKMRRLGGWISIHPPLLLASMRQKERILQFYVNSVQKDKIPAARWNKNVGAKSEPSPMGFSFSVFCTCFWINNNCCGRHCAVDSTIAIYTTLVDTMALWIIPSSPRTPAPIYYHLTLTVSPYHFNEQHRRLVTNAIAWK